jgi:hypothetical protein
VPETPIFKAIAERGDVAKVPAIEAIRLHPKPIAIVFFFELHNHRSSTWRQYSR